jgi:DNA-binding NarL/FixJ family response regulator
MKRITVLLAEDHAVVREDFRKILELEDDFEVVGEAENGRQAVALVKKLQSRSGRHGHRDTIAQWFGSHP